MKSIKILFIYLFLLSSCSSVNEAGKVLRNEKTNTTDEFLVKKRNPLQVPPNYEEIPEPGKLLQKENKKEDEIKKILRSPSKEKTQKNKASSVENSILNKINK